MLITIEIIHPPFVVNSAPVGGGPDVPLKLNPVEIDHPCIGNLGMKPLSGSTT
jgi:hypothetical protein